MATLTINNESKNFSGKREALNYLRDYCRKIRRARRIQWGKKDDVSSLSPFDASGHPLVDMASYHLNNMGATMLIALLEDEGITAKLEIND